MSDLIRLDSSIEVQAAAGEGKPARVNILAYSGQPMEVGGGYGSVLIDLAGLQMPQSVPLLADHVSTLESIAGVGTPAVRAGKLHVEGVISSNETGKRIIALARDGIPLQASVGVNPGKPEHIKPGESVTANGKTFKAGPRGLSLIKAGTLKEVSILPLGADSSTHVAISAKGTTMSAEATPEVETVDDVAAERARIKAIRQHCNGGEFRDIEAQAIDGGWTAERTASEVLVKIRSRAGSYMTGARPRGMAGGYEASPKDTLIAACMLMGGHGQAVTRQLRDGERLANSVTPPRHWSELAALCLSLEGLAVPADRTALLKAGFSTVSLPNALGSSIEKAALDVFIDASKNWLAISRIVNASSFKPGVAVRLAASSALQKVGPTGELKYASLGEDAFNYKLDTYGRIVGVDRQSLINDDLALLTDLPMVLGSEAARTASDLIFSTIASNPGTFFGSGHANVITGAGSALSPTSFGQAVGLLRTRKDADGRVLGLQPTNLIVPAALESQGRQVLNSEFLARAATSDNQGTGNPFQGAANLIVEPRLDASSTTQWYLSSAPRDGFVLVATLGGKLGVIVEDAPQQADLLGHMWRAYFDLGCSLGEWRAAVRSAGA